MGQNLAQSAPFDIEGVIGRIDALHGKDAPVIDRNVISFDLYLMKLKNKAESYKFTKHLEETYSGSFWRIMGLTISLDLFSLVGMLIATNVHSCSLGLEIFLFTATVLLQTVVLLLLSEFIKESFGSIVRL